MRAVLVAAVLFAALAAGCSTWRPMAQPALIFEDSSAALEYRADISGAQREVQGESCRNAVGLPLFWYGGRNLVGWAESGYRDAVRNAQEKAPGASLSDVRADLHVTNVLVFRRECLVVTAAVR